MDADGQLEQAVLANDPRKLRRALAKGANAGRLVRPDGRTVLHLACARGNLEIVSILIDKTTRKMLNKLDAAGYTPLMDAVEGNHMEVVRMLLALGAEVNARSADLGQTALRIAAGQGTLEMVRVLVEAGANPLIPGPLNLTPLDRARERRSPEGRLILALFT